MTELVEHGGDLEQGGVPGCPEERVVRHRRGVPQLVPVTQREQTALAQEDGEAGRSEPQTGQSPRDLTLEVVGVDVLTGLRRPPALEGGQHPREEPTVQELLVLVPQAGAVLLLPLLGVAALLLVALDMSRLTFATRRSSCAVSSGVTGVRHSICRDLHRRQPRVVRGEAAPGGSVHCSTSARTLAALSSPAVASAQARTSGSPSEYSSSSASTRLPGLPFVAISLSGSKAAAPQSLTGASAALRTLLLVLVA